MKWRALLPELLALLPSILRKLSAPDLQRSAWIHSQRRCCQPLSPARNLNEFHLATGCFKDSTRMWSRKAGEALTAIFSSGRCSLFWKIAVGVRKHGAGKSVLYRMRSMDFGSGTSTEQFPKSPSKAFSPSNRSDLFLDTAADNSSGNHCCM